MSSRNGPAHIGNGWRIIFQVRTNRGWLAYTSGMAGEFSASIGCIAMAYGLASQNSACQHALFLLLTCNDRAYPELDFISHPEGFNGEMDLGCFEWMLDAAGGKRSEDG